MKACDSSPPTNTRAVSPAIRWSMGLYQHAGRRPAARRHARPRRRPDEPVGVDGSCADGRFDDDHRLKSARNRPRPARRTSTAPRRSRGGKVVQVVLVAVPRHHRRRVEQVSHPGGPGEELPRAARRSPTRPAGSPKSAVSVCGSSHDSQRACRPRVRRASIQTVVAVAVDQLWAGRPARCAGGRRSGGPASSSRQFVDGHRGMIVTTCMRSKSPRQAVRSSAIRREADAHTGSRPGADQGGCHRRQLHRHHASAPGGTPRTPIHRRDRGLRDGGRRRRGEVAAINVGDRVVTANAVGAYASIPAPQPISWPTFRVRVPGRHRLRPC